MEWKDNFTEQKLNFDSDLEKCETMQEILFVCSKHYDLDEKLGFGTKLIVSSGLHKVLKLIKAKERKQ